MIGLISQIIDGVLQAQDPYLIDPTFNAVLNNQPLDVRDILPLANGQYLVSNSGNPPQNTIQFGFQRLNEDGTPDASFAFVPGYYEFSDYNDQHFYAKGGYYGTWFARFYKETGAIDTTFDIQQNSPELEIWIIEDAHILEDGTIMLAGQFDIEGIPGIHCIVYFHLNGSIDYDRPTLRCQQQVVQIIPLSDGGYILSGVIGHVNGVPSGHTIKLTASGEWDPGFYAPYYWGSAYDAHLLDDGRILAVGRFIYPPDTLRLLRWMPDGSLDPTFNYEHQFYSGLSLGVYNTSIRVVSDDQLVVTGSFVQVDSEPRGGIALFSSEGDLVNTAFNNGGFGQVQMPYGRVWVQLKDEPEGGVLAYGIFNGYTDLTGSFPQSKVARFASFPTSIEESTRMILHAWPNPAISTLYIDIESCTVSEGVITLHALDGKQIHHQVFSSGDKSGKIDVSDLMTGMYTLSVITTRGEYKGVLVSVIRE